MTHALSQAGGGMTDEPQRKGKGVSLGWAKPDDPIYTGGWNFIMGKNLNPNLARTPAHPSADKALPEPSAPDP
jgi:hypothetical protein